jgi:hypothetical protein
MKWELTSSETTARAQVGPAGKSVSHVHCHALTGAYCLYRTLISRRLTLASSSSPLCLCTVRWSGEWPSDSSRTLVGIICTRSCRKPKDIDPVSKKTYSFRYNLRVLILSIGLRSSPLSIMDRKVPASFLPHANRLDCHAALCEIAGPGGVPSVFRGPKVCLLSAAFSPCPAVLTTHCREGRVNPWFAPYVIREETAGAADGDV